MAGMDEQATSLVAAHHARGKQRQIRRPTVQSLSESASVEPQPASCTGKGRGARPWVSINVTPAPSNTAAVSRPLR
jgi:hypothetical protein